jgi:glutaminyl-peptide cyclotransferase
MKRLLLFLLPALIIGCKNKDTNGTEPGGTNPAVKEQPAVLSYSILSPSYPHDTSSFTQGLCFYKGELFEGTGLEGKSKLMKVDLKTGKALKSIKLDEKE